VVTNQYCGAGELIESGINGQRYDADTDEALVQALELARSGYDSYRDAARASAEQHPIERMVEAMLALYRELLEVKAGTPV
jgi:glycosyltransferase involved in cell wall biosynthesis